MVWKINGKGESIKEIWEDLYGDLWFVAEKEDKDGIAFGYVRLYHMPDCAEWGSFRISDVKEAVGNIGVWKVKK